MTAKKNESNQINSALRVPKAKKKLGLFVPSISLPHDDLVKPEAPPDSADAAQSETAEAIDFTPTEITLPSQTSHTSQTSLTRQSSISRKIRNSNPAREPEQTGRTEVRGDVSTAAVSPLSDYQKVPNSLVKDAIPAGYFKGKSKQLYDVLYALTRGAIAPVRTTRIRKAELMKKANIGSRNTFDINIKHLQTVGLIREKILAGEHSGNEFEIFTYEEILTLPSVTSQTSLTTLTGSSQKLVRLVRAETGQTRQSLNEETTDSYDDLKTLLKTILRDDDETRLRASLRRLNETAKNSTGRELTEKDWEALGEIIDLVIDETQIASSKTETVTSYLKFAAENLRRRLYQKPGGARIRKTGETKSAGNLPPEEKRSQEMPEPLGPERELLLGNLQNIYREDGPEAIEIFKENYTDEDWRWMLENIAERG